MPSVPAPYFIHEKVLVLSRVERGLAMETFFFIIPLHKSHEHSLGFADKIYIKRAAFVKINLHLIDKAIKRNTKSHGVKKFVMPHPGHFISCVFDNIHGHSFAKSTRKPFFKKIEFFVLTKAAYRIANPLVRRLPK